MSAFNKFHVFTTDLCTKVHNLNSDTLNIYLSNDAPSASGDSVKADLAEISAGGGYTGPIDTQNTGSGSSGTYTVSGTKVTITATGGVSQFRYVVLYNDTAASDPLIGWWDFGSSIDLQTGETFTVKFNGSDTTGSILTVT